jgi:hypothetical protein
VPGIPSVTVWWVWRITVAACWIWSPVFVAEVGRVVLDAADQRRELVNLLVGWGQVSARPILEVAGRADALPVGEQLLKVGPQLA